jgi:hypothetical protein
MRENLAAAGVLLVLTEDGPLSMSAYAGGVTREVGLLIPNLLREIADAMDKTIGALPPGAVLVAEVGGALADTGAFLQGPPTPDRTKH